MAKESLSGKLAVILHADVAGSTALVQQNEQLAHDRIQSASHRLGETIAKYHGKVHELRGDALLAEFKRASDAVIATLAFQADQTNFNSQHNGRFQLMVRVGIAIGEVVIADNTITGTGVILAQRLEQLSSPGGVVLQGACQETIPGRFPFEYESLGEQELKGFDQPVRAFTVRLSTGEMLPLPDSVSFPQDVEEGGRHNPDIPSIAVLPFVNMSADPEQEFFSDGITEDIITALSKISSLWVIARNSTFIYKNKAVDIKQVGREQGVVYVLEGSVRKIGNRVRVTAQLIDSRTGHHKWAENYDRELEDVFAVQDEILLEIVSELGIQLLAGEQGRFWASGTKNFKAWEYCQLGGRLLDSYRSEDIPEAIRFAQKAIDLEPDYAMAWLVLSGCHYHIEEDARHSKEEREKAFELSKQCVEQALKCDHSSPDAYAMLALCHLSENSYDEAINSANKSVELAPSHASNYAISAIVLNKCGESEIALERIRKAMLLCLVHPIWFLSTLGQVSRVLGRVDESINAYTKMIEFHSDHLEAHIGLTNILGESNQLRQAEIAAGEVLRIAPNFSTKEYVANLAYRDQSQVVRFEEGLLNAGLPE